MKRLFHYFIICVICTLPVLYSFSLANSCRGKNLLQASERFQSTLSIYRSFLNSHSSTQINMKEDDETAEDVLMLAMSSHLGMDASIRLVLASQSPRRVEILEMMGLKGKFDVSPSPLDETALQEKLVRDNVSNPADYTRMLAEEKARALAENMLHLSAPKQTVLVLGSDTVVDIGSQILEKPIDQESAKRMLKRLSGVQHSVHTGVALYQVDPGEAKIQLVDSFTDEATVVFAKLSDEVIDAYIATGEPMDKAGSYGIQGMGGQLVQRIEGDFFTVMGLPMHRTSRLIAKAISIAIRSSTTAT